MANILWKEVLLGVMVATSQPTELTAVERELPADPRLLTVERSPAQLTSTGTYPYTLRLSENYNLGQVSSRAAVSKYAVRPQHGLDREEIVGNLRSIVNDVLEPIRRRYPDVVVTSGFRVGNSRSQHERGQALDLQFPAHRADEYPTIADDIRRLVPHDQLLLEYQTRGSRQPWIHVSYRNDGANRMQVMTLRDHRVIGTGVLS